MANEPLAICCADTILSCYRDYQSQFSDITRRAPDVAQCRPIESTRVVERDLFTIQGLSVAAGEQDGGGDPAKFVAGFGIEECGTRNHDEPVAIHLGYRKLVEARRPVALHLTAVHRLVFLETV